MRKWGGLRRWRAAPAATTASAAAAASSGSSSRASDNSRDEDDDDGRRGGAGRIQSKDSGAGAGIAGILTRAAYTAPPKRYLAAAQRRSMQHRHDAAKQCRAALHSDAMPVVPNT
eukprot:gene4299-biopygen1904